MKNIIKKSIVAITAIAIILTLATPVTAEAAAKVKLNKTKVTLNVKKTCQLKVTGAKKKVTWKSNKPKVAKVSSKGKVTAITKGTATITAKVSGKKYTCKVTVKQPVTSVTLNKKTATLTKKGATVVLKATVKPSNAGNKKATWKSSNTKVATVSGNGKVTAVANGTATITATAADGSKKKANCKVTVKIAGSGNGDTNNSENTTDNKPGNTDDGNTNTGCQHNWVKQEETTYVTACGCGLTFTSADEWRTHNLEMAMKGETNGHSCTRVPVVNTKYVCSICHAEKE